MDQKAKGFILCGLVFAISFIDAYFTNKIGFEANPAMIPFLGWGLYAAKLATLPLLGFLGYVHPRVALARFGMAVATVAYVCVIVSEIYFLYVWRA